MPEPLCLPGSPPRPVAPAAIARSCAVPLQQVADVAQDLRDALLLLQDAGGELLGRQVGDVFFAARVLAVEVAVRGQELGGGDAPGARVLLAGGPPGAAGREFLVLDRRGLRVALAALGQRLLVVPNLV